MQIQLITLKKKEKNQHSQAVLVFRVSGFRPWRRSGSSQGLGPRIFFQSSKAESFIFYRATKIKVYKSPMALFRTSLNE